MDHAGTLTEAPADGTQVVGHRWLPAGQRW